MPVMTGSDAVVQSLIAEGIDLVFGIPGYHSEHLYGRLMQQDSIRHVLVRHEQGAGYMAIGAARVTGKPACLLSTAGPGALNVATPMGEAYGDGVPLLNIMAEDLSPYLYQDKGWSTRARTSSACSAACRSGAGRPCPPGRSPAPSTRQCAAWKSTARGRRWWRFRSTSFQGEGPVEILARESCARPGGDAGDIERAASLLRDAERPLIWAGGGVINSGAWDELQQVAELLDAPVLTTCSGKGSIPDDHPLALTNISTHGPVTRLMERCDAMLAVGAVFPHLITAKWTLPIPERLIHIDIDPTQPGKNYPAEIGIHADAKLALAALTAALDGGDVDRDDWVDTARTARADVRRDLAQRAPLEWELMQTVRDALPRETIVACDPHLWGYWAREHFPIYEPRTFLYGLQFGTLGYAYPVGLGAKLAAPERPVVAIGGDGGFLFTGQELATAVQLGINVPHGHLQRRRLRRDQRGLRPRLRQRLRSGPGEPGLRALRGGLRRRGHAG